MEYYRVKAGIWNEGPVAFLSEEALYSFEARGMFLLYDSRNHPGFTMTAEITDRDIQFFRTPTNEPRQNHLTLPMENGPRGFAALAVVAHPITRAHTVRCHLYETMGYWSPADRFIIGLPCAPHVLPFPNKKDLTPEMIIADIEARRETAMRLTGRPYVSLPDYYIKTLTPEQRVSLYTGNHTGVI